MYNFIQEKIKTYSESRDELKTNSRFYNRYSFIVTDLIQRKLLYESTENISIFLNKLDPLDEHRLNTVQQKKMDENGMDNLFYINSSNNDKYPPSPSAVLKTTKKLNAQRIKWKPERTPNSPISTDILQSLYFPNRISLSAEEAHIQDKLMYTQDRKQYSKGGTII